MEVLQLSRNIVRIFTEVVRIIIVEEEEVAVAGRTTETIIVVTTTTTIATEELGATIRTKTPQTAVENIICDLAKDEYFGN